MAEQQVIMVDEHDEPVGLMEKMEAHRNGILHRAFSIFIFDGKGRMLLQQRAPQKYHGGGLWTNACCSHPYPEENVEHAAGRRLQEEMGIQTPLEKIFHFTYYAKVENNLIEHEFDHVFAGSFEGEIHPNADEVADYTYLELWEVKRDLEMRPERFTSWFKIAFPRIEEWWTKQFEGVATR